MKKTILSFLFYGLSLFALRAQNLVPNWSFEQHDSCPYSDGQIYFANGWFNIAYYPDYYNSCSSVYYSVPTTLDGYNFYSDTTGGGDAIIWPYSMYVPWITAAEHTPPNLRISFGCQLSTALQIGTKYYVSFAIRFVICNHSYDYGIGVNGACNKIGALFSTVSYVMPKDSESSRIANYKNSLLSIKNYAQVYTNSVISDTSRWVVISGSFIADSAYTYINIGNFFDDSLTNFDFLFNDTASSHEYQAAYLVDDVCVTDDSIASCASEWTGINTLPAKKITMLVTPNPFSEYTTISVSNIPISDFAKARLSVFDMLGRRVRDGTINLTNNKYTFSRNNLSNGMYIIQIEIANKVFREKIIIS